VPKDGQGHQKYCQQGDMEPDGRKMASMREQGKKPKGGDARPRTFKTAGDF
jgi:hypothetical protein